MTFIQEHDGTWWEFDENKMTVSNYSGGFHSIALELAQTSETITCESWHELYLQKGYCPLEVTVRWPEIWISPDGKYYNGEAHENRAEEILEIIYGENDIDWHGDRLEELGWIRAAKNLMWEVRLDSGYWNNRHLTQKQYDALWDWCEKHGKTFPNNIEIQ